MAITLTNVVGPVVLPDGTKPTGGVITFQMTSWDQESGEAVIVPGPLSFALDASGDFDADLWTSEEGENGVTYLVSVQYSSATSSGSQSRSLSLGQIALNGAGPLTIESLLAIPVTEPTPPDVLAQAIAAKAAAELSASSAEFDADRAEVAANYASGYAQDVIDPRIFGWPTDGTLVSDAQMAALKAVIDAQTRPYILLIPDRCEFTFKTLLIENDFATVVVRGNANFPKGEVFDELAPPIVFKFQGQPLNYLKYPTVILDGGTVDGAGAETSAYTYGTGERYDSILFDYCDDPMIMRFSGGKITNGLVGCGMAQRCRRPVFVGVEADGSVHDNGLAFSLPPVGFVENDPSTWTNGRMVDCYTHDNNDFGQTFYNSKGCVNINGVSIGNGNDTEFTGGGFSVEGPDAGGLKDLQCRLLNPRAHGNITSGIFTTAAGITVDNPDILGVESSSPQVFHGHGIASLGAPAPKIRGGKISGAVRDGAFSQAGAYTGSNEFTTVDIDGTEITGNGGHGIYAKGVTEANIGPSTHVHGNGSEDQVLVVNSGGATFNEGAGELFARPKVDRAVRRSVRAEYLGSAAITGVVGRNERVLGVLDAPIQINNCGRGVASGNRIYESTSGSEPAAVIRFSAVTTVQSWDNGGDFTGNEAHSLSSVGDFIPGASRQKVFSKSADYTIGLHEDGRGFSNTAAMAFTLPDDAPVGFSVKLFKHAGGSMTVVPGQTVGVDDRIALTGASGASLSNVTSQVGVMIELTKTSSSIWSAVSLSGTWS